VKKKRLGNRRGHALTLSSPYAGNHEVLKKRQRRRGSGNTGVAIRLLHQPGPGLPPKKKRGSKESQRRIGGGKSESQMSQGPAIGPEGRTIRRKRMIKSRR